MSQESNLAPRTGNTGDAIDWSILGTLACHIHLRSGAQGLKDLGDVNAKLDPGGLNRSGDIEMNGSVTQAEPGRISNSVCTPWKMNRSGSPQTARMPFMRKIRAPNSVASQRNQLPSFKPSSAPGSTIAIVSMFVRCRCALCAWS